MAQESGRREIIQDPLRTSGREAAPDRSVQLNAVRAPEVPGSFQSPLRQVSAALDKVQGAVNTINDQAKDDAIIAGKTAFLSGVTEAEMIKTGNRWTQEGYQQLATTDTINKFVQQETLVIQKDGYQIDSPEYQTQLQQRTKGLLDGIKDPAARKIAAAQLETFQPQLAQKQLLQNNEYNRTRTINASTDDLLSGKDIDPAASRRVVPNTALKISDVPVAPTFKASGYDRDIAIRTMLGEAANEGDLGLAAVAHVITNRTADPRWPNSIAAVALQDKQFSAWNKGAGGNSLVSKYGPGNALYEKAGVIFDAVTSGRHVDPTNGATHYYSPSGMKALVAAGSQANELPSWARQTASESGGEIVIGGHIFSGRSKGVQASVESSDKPLAVASREDRSVESLRKDAEYYKKSNPNASAQFSARADALEKESRTAITTEVTPAERGGENSKLANDSAAVVVDPTAEIIKPKTGPNAAAAAAVEEGTAATGVQPGTRSAAIDRLISNPRLSSKDKATALSNALKRDLLNGSDQLYRDAQGVGKLQELGASPAEIESVQKAREKWEKDQEKKFDADDEAWRSSILKRVGDGELDEKAALAEIGAKVKKGSYSEAEAKSLARAATETYRQYQNKGEDDSAKLADPTFLTALGGLYQQIKIGGLDFAASADQAKQIATKFGISEKGVKTIMSRVFELDQSRQDTLRSEAKANAQKYRTNEESKRQVDEALARGNGLGSLNGSVDSIDIYGKKSSMTLQQYGVNRVKDQAAAKFTKLVEQGEMSAGEAKAAMYVETYKTLQKHGVVDEHVKSEFRGALTGDIMDPKTKTVTTGAQEAYDMYVTLKKSGDIDPGYLGKLVGDDRTRLLLENAMEMDAGNLSGQEALQRASHIFNTPELDPQRKLNQDVEFKKTLDTEVKKTMKEMSQPGLFAGIVGAFDSSERERFSSEGNMNIAEAYITRRAESYKRQEPGTTSKSALETALQDLKANSTYVAGNLVINDSKVPLTEAMGLQGFPNVTVDTVTKEFLAAFGGSKNMWGSIKTDKFLFGLGGGHSVFDVASGRAARSNEIPNLLSGGFQKNVEYSIQYNPQMKAFQIDLYKDSSKGITFGNPKIIGLKEMGEWYKTEQKKISGWDRMWDKGFGAVADAVRESNKTRTNPSTDPAAEYSGALPQ